MLLRFPARTSRTTKDAADVPAQEGMNMSFIDVAIPAIIGVVALVWPQAVFYGSRASPDDKKIRLIRGVGALLLVVAAVYLGIKLAAA